MIRYTTGDLFEAQTEAIVNTVNTMGVMGKGIALQFKQRFPENYESYRAACKAGALKVGELLVTENRELYFKYIINFPTKTHWRYPSKYEYIEDGLDVLVSEVKKLGIKSIAMPPLGAGNGKLDWNKVKPIIEKHLAELKDVDIIIYEPQAVFEERDNKHSSTSRLTPARVMLLQAFNEYDMVDSSLNLLVTQKLAYFIQRFGEPLRLQYAKGWYGPYAANLNKVLQAINGTYIAYEAQYDKPATQVDIIHEAYKQVEDSLYMLNDQQKQIAQLVKGFTEGFETPFSMELLATVDWIIQEQPAITPEQIYHEIGQWTKRKAELIKPHHVKVAYQHLISYKQHLYPNNGI